MRCERINTCNFLASVSEALPATAVMIKAMSCRNVDYGCAKDQEHEVIAIDKERGNLCPGMVMNGLEIFEKKYSETYMKLCVRRHREVTGIQYSEL